MCPNWNLKSFLWPNQSISVSATWSLGVIPTIMMAWYGYRRGKQHASAVGGAVQGVLLCR